MDKMQIQLAKVIEGYFGADAGYLDISCLDLAKRILDAGWEKPVRYKECMHVSHDTVFGDYWCGGQRVFANHFCSCGKKNE